ncbi:MAG: hypothetical protein C4K60_05625 [Ideonella sp. MAG2]|nr:MAG: hypothetical protein C4K60_05625 [Ideonella sp. MAG2]
MVSKKPARWSGSDDALRAVQVAFDVEQAVMNAVRTAAFHNNLSTSDQIRQVLQLSTAQRPKRPRLTVSLTAQDYDILAARYGIAPEDRLAIKERVTQELIHFAKPAGRR